jgi:glycolate oxidase FAD binding subunit
VTTTTAISLQEALAGLVAIAGTDHARLAGNRAHVAPADAEEIAQILRFADANTLSVIPTGSGTKLNWGNAVSPDIELSLERLNALREHAWEDLTCTVQAGCSWATMQGNLARHGQMVALDPLWPERATVGGVVASNDSGALRLRYGGLRDLIIGMTLVLADGSIAKTGGKVVKNVAGYDLHKLLTGSFGTLGVITEVNFRLHPVERHVQNWTISGDRDSLIDLMMGVLASTMQVSAMQLRGPQRQSSDRLDIRFAVRPECQARQKEQLHAMAANLEMTPAGDEIWLARENLFNEGEARDGLVFKAAMLPTQIAAIEKILAAWPGETISVTQATGIMTAAVFSGTLQYAMLIDELRETLRASSGSVIVLRMPQSSSPQPDVWGCQSDALPLMREIKRRFDPNRVLSPGRFVGGI